MSCNKKIIFIGGADFSGTTMLDMILGSCEGVKSLGEVHALYWPTDIRHATISCTCGSNCPIWKKVYREPINVIYTSLFKEYINANVLVDSSKSLPWILKKSKELRKRGHDVYNILIWKSPEDYMASCIKRGRAKGCMSRWITYYFAYLSRINNAYFLHLDDLLNDFDRTSRELCNWIGLKHNVNMKEYWRVEHHILFGSATARLELHSNGSPEYHETVKSSFKNNEELNCDLQLKNSLLDVMRYKKINYIIKVLSGDKKLGAIQKILLQPYYYILSAKSLLRRTVFMIKMYFRS